MSIRDMSKIVKATKVNRRYDLMSNEIFELLEYSTKWGRHEVDAILVAFKYGYAMGQRALKAELRRKRMEQRKQKKNRGGALSLPEQCKLLCNIKL